MIATDVKSHFNEVKTYQYAAKDVERKIDKHSGLNIINLIIINK